MIEWLQWWWLRVLNQLILPQVWPLRSQREPLDSRVSTPKSCQSPDFIQKRWTILDSQIDVSTSSRSLKHRSCTVSRHFFKQITLKVHHLVTLINLSIIAKSAAKHAMNSQHKQITKIQTIKLDTSTPCFLPNSVHCFLNLTFSVTKSLNCFEECKDTHSAWMDCNISRSSGLRESIHMLSGTPKSFDLREVLPLPESNEGTTPSGVLWVNSFLVSLPHLSSDSR